MTVNSGLASEKRERLVRLVTGADYAPFTMPTLVRGGVVSDVVQEIFTYKGYKTELSFYPWKRSYQRVKNLKSDVSFPFAKGLEREKDMLYSRPINAIRVLLFEYVREFRNLTLEKAAQNNLTYCLPLGYQLEPQLIEHTNKGRLTRFEAIDMAACFKALGQGRVDFVIASELVGWQMAEKALGSISKKLIKPADQPFNTGYGYVVVSKDHPNGEQLIQDFNDGYETLLKNGRLKEIWQKHLGDLVGPAVGYAPERKHGD